MSETIGCIGLGIMGRPMARNLMRAGYNLVVFDVASSALEEFVADSAAAAGPPAEVAGRAQRVITMLPNGPTVEEVVCGTQGVLGAAGCDSEHADRCTAQRLVGPPRARAHARGRSRLLLAPHPV